MDLLKENWIRITYGSVCACIVWAAYRYQGTVLSDKDAFDRLSYIGGIATFIGLVITGSEVLHAISISKGIRAEARALLAQARTVDRAALLSECLLMIDRINDDLIDRRHATALQTVQQMRRSYLRAMSTSPSAEPLAGELAELEQSLQEAIRSGPRSASFPKRVQSEIQKRCLDVKQSLEQLISGRRPHDVS